MADVTYRDGLGRPLTYQEADDNFRFVEEQAVAAEGFALDAQGFAITAQNAADSAQNIIDDAVADIEFAVEDNANRIRNLEYGSGPYPSLDLLFTGAKSVDPRIEFERATTATYYDEMGVLQTAGPNEPRIDYDPETGECRGLLVEGQATNLLRWSEDFTQGVWTTTGTTITANAITAPDGSLTADKLVEDSTFGIHDIRHGGTQTESGFVLTGYFKAAERRYVALLITSISGPNSHATYDLVDGLVTDIISNDTTAEIEPLLGGWYRCVLRSLADTVASGGYYRLTNGPNYTNRDYQGDGTSGIYIWGAQLEQGNHPTSYIPTEGSQVTRAADDASIETDDWYNPNEGTFVVSGKADINKTLIHIANILGDGTGCTVERGSAGVYRVSSRDQSAGTDSIVPLASSNDQVTIAFSIKSGERVRASMNGSAVSIGAAAAWNGDASHVFIGNGSVTGSGRNLRHPNHPLRRLTYFPRALSDSELIALTQL